MKFPSGGVGVMDRKKTTLAIKSAREFHYSGTIYLFPLIPDNYTPPSPLFPAPLAQLDRLATSSSHSSPELNDAPLKF